MMAMSKGESDGEFLKADWRLIAPLRLLGTVVSAEAKNDEERGGCGGKEGAFRDICGKPLSSASLYVLGVGVRGDADSHPSASSSISRRQQSSYRVGNAGDRGHTSSGVSGDSAHSTDGRRDEAGEAGGVATARELTQQQKQVLAPGGGGGGPPASSGPPWIRGSRSSCGTRTLIRESGSIARHPAAGVGAASTITG
ncbi:hypothetical protein TcYC6_0077000 [Trypanosoma cruzi]|nr:hypothetical protein TcYC6_0077000 [Trypanosoma cruzi]